VSLRVTNYDRDWRLLKPVWNEIVANQSEGIQRLDVTCTLEWAETLEKALLRDKKRKTLIVEQDDNIVGILPLYESNESRYGVRANKIAPITELYSGRCGFIFKEYRLEYLNAVIDYLYAELKDWSLFQLTLVEHSESDLLLEESCRRKGLNYYKIYTQVSPYIVFDNTWQNYFNSLPKKFRWHLRNGTKKLEAAGTLRYSTCRKASELERFLASAFEIERASWKEIAGSSITTNDYQMIFYKNFCVSALDRGWFYGHLLEVAGEPIAYIYGIVYQGVFYDFKESYKVQYKESSPGHVLKTFVFDELCKRNIRLYDFMGACDDYKMKWTDKTYSRSTYVLYNDNLGGLALRLAEKVARYLRHRSMRSNLDRRVRTEYRG
jgi:hypothetical protein